MEINKQLRKNIYSALMLGSVSCSLLVVFEGVTALTLFLKALNPPDLVANFFILLFFIYIASGFYIIYLKKNKKTLPNFIVVGHNVFSNVGFTLQGIVLAMAGGIWVTFLSIILSQTTIDNFVYLVFSYAFSVVLIYSGCFMSSVKEIIENKIENL